MINLFYFFYILFSLLGIGILSINILGLEKKKIDLHIAFFFGLICVSFFVTFGHIFISKIIYLNHLIYFFGFLFFIYFFYNKKISLFDFKYYYIIIFIVGLAMFYNYEPNEDFGYYHLPYVVNFVSDKIIFGLSNLQLNQGWNSIWLNFKSSLVFSDQKYESIFFSNFYLFIILNIFFYSELLKNFREKNHLLFFLLFFFYCFFIIKFSRFNSYGLDVISNFFCILCIYIFLKINTNTKFTAETHKQFLILIIFVLFSIFLRIINVLLIFLLLYLIFSKKINIFKILKDKAFIFIILFFLSWVGQQFIYTSCILIPHDLSCVDTIWYDSDIASKFKNDVSYVNKSFQSYSGDLTRNEYLSDFNWVSTWFSRQKSELVEHSLTFFTPIIFFLISCIFLGQKNITLKINLKFSYFFLIFFTLIYFFIWFLNAPVIRFGTHIIQLLFFLILYPTVGKFLKFNKKIIISIIFICLVFNLSKNIKRISQKIVHQQSIFPNIQKVDHELIEETPNYKLFIPRPKQGVTKSEYCWATQYMCTTKVQNKIKVIKGYKFILD